MAGLYIHIPFCHSKCAYCDFFSTPAAPVDPTAYVDALLDEFDARRDSLPEPISTVYIGGGTPSSLPIPQLRRLIRRFATLRPEEFTVEVNPEDVTTSLADALLTAGVNRLSMGVQSLNDDELRFVGRRHSAAQAIEAVATLRRVGFTNLSLDLIYGLPLQTLDSWNRTLSTLIDLNPQHISAYALSFEPGTRLWAMLQAGKITPLPDNEWAAMYSHLCQSLANAGFDHYEIANFALPGRYSRHNSSYWLFTPYLGLGPGAHSFDGLYRSYNPSDIKHYITSPSTAAVIDPETPANRHNDYVMVALRTARGLDMDDYLRRFGPQAAERVHKIARRFVTRGSMQQTTSGYRISEDSWLTSDSLIIDFFQ